MRRLKTLLLIAVVLAKSAAPAIADPRDAFVIQMADVAGIQSIQATVDGRQGTFLFDSGMGVSAVTPETAEAIGCKPWGKLTGFRAIGERVDTQLCNETHLVVGGRPITMPQLAVIDLKHFMGPVGEKFAGVLGLDIFDGQTITISVAKEQIVIEDAKSLARIAASSQAVPLRIVRSGEGAALTVDFGVPTSSGMSWWEMDTGTTDHSWLTKCSLHSFGSSPTRRNPRNCPPH